MNRDQYLFPLSCMLACDVGRSRCKHKLLIYCLIKRGVSRTARIQTIKPLGKCIFNFDVMSLDLSLQPQGQCRVVYAGLPGNIHLFDIVLGQRLQHLRADVLLSTLSHILCRNQSPYTTYIYIQSQNNFKIMDRFLDRLTRPSCTHKHKHNSVKNKTITSLDDRFTSKVYTSPSKMPNKGVSQQIIAENQKLRRENEILQEYFVTFDERYREQRKENEALKRQLKEIRKGKEVRSPDKKSEVTHCLSQRTLVQKISRTSKSNKANPLTQYL